jgi:biopolymer transport protein ExbD
MARRKHYRRIDKEPPELNITTFLNLMVVLVPFLLITAVFSRITIMELNLPAGVASSASLKPQAAIEVIVREKGLEIGNGKSILARWPKVDGEYDFKRLTEHLLKLKATFPDKTDATVLMEADLEYDYLIQTMDLVRSAEVRQQGSEEVQKVALFPDISIGDAP